MISTVRSFGLFGIRSYDVSIECFLSNGLPSFDVVGLPDTAVKESRERVRASLKSCGYDFPLRRITVNLAPADMRKEGSLYDLPIMLGLLSAQGNIKPIPSDCAFFGELSLEGALRPVNGALPMALCAARSGIKNLFVPAENAREAALADVAVFPAAHVKQILGHISGKEPLSPAQPERDVISSDQIPDFSDVKGQENVKRALEIAAAGGHNILLIGPPGAGKSMLARRLPSILPDMSFEESLESTEIHSVAGLTSSKNPLIINRPFRAPHHTISSIGMSGGGRIPRPGEISLAHCGVLFLDEMPEFSKDALEVLRQPLEDGEVTISRVAGSLTYPCRFMLVCAMNPCQCGWRGHPSGRCTCSQSSVESYMQRISGPILDRIDMHVEVPSLPFDGLSKRDLSEPSSAIRARVNRARQLQRKRCASSAGCNAHLTPELMRTHCFLDSACTNLMKSAFDSLGLTARSYDRILRVARTIADLDESDGIAPIHLAEAIQFRTLDLRRR